MITSLVLATDSTRSVLLAGKERSFAYTPFGMSSPHRQRSGYNGLLLEPGRFIAFGNGYRPYLPLLHRFGRYDSLSPFGPGGINGYAYCNSDPINKHDPDGRAPVWWKWVVQQAEIRQLVRPRPIILPSGPITGVGRPMASVARVRGVRAIPANTGRGSRAFTRTHPIERPAPEPVISATGVEAAPASASSRALNSSYRATNGRIEPALPLLNLHEAPRVRGVARRSSPRRQSEALRPPSPDSDMSYDSDDSFVGGPRVIIRYGYRY
ncbi:RHS repeat-associated core domain-containing protein [Pseudomonas massiliensis]|uniref:RHS repeat-associated core domain-containing protein n=1 Tax=Pseudomonas massiliensis TaxID=522492 RepID=UPI000A02361C